MPATRIAAAAAAVTCMTVSAMAPPVQAQPESARPAAPMLTREDARARSRRVSGVGYDLRFRLSADLPEYSGDVTIAFALGDPSRDLTLDFNEGTIRSLALNGVDVDGRYNGYYLTLPASELRRGPNRVEIAFSRPYSSDGSGLYRFVDPEDGRAYLYTDFEPYNQNRLFPSFDQPDLKARYTTEVTAPADWHVIANTRETSIREDGDERVWSFPATLPISTYVYALHAGQYHVWESSAGRVPLRLFARESLVPYVHPEHWFLPTRQGFGFFQDYFEIAYPFLKYDQVIVPHFNAGAMENVGAVTFSERYLRRGAVTRQDRRAITRVILHELAHMWFGNLVTMDWWNGLWLNESFATVMSVLAMVDATEFTDEWQEAYRDTIRAYQADERDTTHPIELPVPDTDAAFANFDRITYQKGSATLVQLMHLVGPESFRRGVGNYLREHSYGNTDIDDFLGAISAAAGRELDRWARDWLLEPGTNTVEADYACSNGRLSSLAIVQGAPEEWPTLRTHRTQLGFYYFGSGDVGIRTLPVTYRGERTELDAATIGADCPDLIYSNHGDWDYARVRLDPGALALLGEHLARFDDSLVRLMLWQSVWDMVLDARLPVTEYLEFALANVGGETDEQATRQVLNALGSSLEYLTEMPDAATHARSFRPRVESLLWRRVLDEQPGSDRQLLFFDTYVSAVASPDGLERVAGLLADPGQAPPGIELDQDRRWAVLMVLSRTGHPSFERLYSAETARDRSDEGRRRARSITAAQPDAALKSGLLDALLDPARISNLADFRAVAAGLFPRGQHELQLRFSQEALAGLGVLNATREAEFFSSYVGGLLGPICSDAFQDRLARTIAAESDDLHPVIVRGLKDSRFEVARCLSIAATQAQD